MIEKLGKGTGYIGQLADKINEIIEVVNNPMYSINIKELEKPVCPKPPHDMSGPEHTCGLNFYCHGCYNLGYGQAIMDSKPTKPVQCPECFGAYATHNKTCSRNPDNKPPDSGFTKCKIEGCECGGDAIIHMQEVHNKDRVHPKPPDNLELDDVIDKVLVMVGHNLELSSEEISTITKLLADKIREWIRGEIRSMNNIFREGRGNTDLLCRQVYSRANEDVIRKLCGK